MPKYGLLRNARNPFALSDNDATVIVDGPNAACFVTNKQTNIMQSQLYETP